MSGTQAPSGTFFSAAPQNRPERIQISHQIPIIDQICIAEWILTVDEAKEDEVRKPNDDRQLFHVAALDGYEDRGGEHDCRYCESAGSSLLEDVRKEWSRH